MPDVSGDLRDAIEAFRGGAKGPCVTDLSANAGDDKPRRRSFLEHRGRLVLWPVENTSDSVHALLDALGDGVVPVIVPTLPSRKLASVKRRFANIGSYSRDGIEATVLTPKAPAEVWIAMMTSGSTGQPKIIATTAARLTCGVRAIHRAQKLDACGSTYAVLPLAYSFAFVNQLMWSVLFGRRLVVSMGMLSPAHLFNAIRETGASMLCFVANQYRELCRVGLHTIAPMKGVLVVNFAGAPFPTELLPQLKALFPAARFYNNYGCTEAMPRISVAEVCDEAASAAEVGVPLEGLKIRVTGGDTGVIQFRGESAALGTLRDDLTLEVFDEWIESGDFGKISEGNVLHVLGRIDQIVKIGGERVSLAEIEQTLIEFGARQASVWQFPDREYASAAVMGVDEGNLSRLKSFLRNTLVRAAWPRELHRVTEWPRLANGKTDRLRIQKQAAELALERLW